MVDALLAASRWLTLPHGRILDLRPAGVVARVEIGTPDGTICDVGGLVVEDARRARHAAADAAIRSVTTSAALVVEDEAEFAFFRYADSASELRDYIATKWRETRMAADTHDQAAALLRRTAGARLWLREPVMIRTLMPPGSVRL
jgi:hypothetical protein